MGVDREGGGMERERGVEREREGGGGLINRGTIYCVMICSNNFAVHIVIEDDSYFESSPRRDLYQPHKHSHLLSNYQYYYTSQYCPLSCSR